MKRLTTTFVTALLALGSATDAHAVSVAPYVLSEDGFFGLPLTNSMVTSWVISALLILAIRLAVKKPKIIPQKGQAVVESMIGGLRDLLEPIVGKRLIGPTTPLLIGIFTFVLIHNWSGLLPGVGSFGFVDEHGHLKYWMRPGNADLNMTIGLGIVAALVCWFYFVIKYAGLKTLAYDIFGNKADRADVGTFMWVILVPVFLAVGLIELLSIAVRPVSLGFRLFGNVFGGENLLSNMLNMPYIGWLVPVPFYFLELLIGLVQALVFTLLTAVYIGLITNHGDDEHGHAHAH